MNGDALHVMADRLWSWDLLGRGLGVHPGIRPGDADGWMQQRGEMLFLEGKVSRGVPGLSKPQMDAVNEMGNLTILLIHTDPDHWADNRPSRVRGFYVLASQAYPYQASRCYQPLPSTHRDEDTLSTISNLVVGWCMWAGTKGAS